MASKKHKKQAGNAIVFLFAAIAMAGTVTYGLNNIMRGPAVTTNEVSRRTIAENNLIATSRLAVVAATTQQTDGGDCDADGFVEAMPYRDAGVLPKPTGGGLLPMTMGASVSDPWGTQYGYCVWDPGTVSVSNAVPACGGATPRRLQGAPRDDQSALAIISAGKNGAFETTCNSFVDTTPADGKPDTALVVKAGGSDDIVLSYTYAEANGIGGGVWKLKDGDDTTAVVGKNVEVAGGATFNDGPLTLENKGLVLPGDPGDDSVTGACDEAKDQQMRRNIGNGMAIPIVEICDYAGGDGWIQVGAGGLPPIPPTQEIMELLADTPAASDSFGGAVHVSGNLAIVGMPNDDDNGAQSGSAYIFEKSGGVWTLSQKITASDGAADDIFGNSVAIAGDFAIVGARQDDDGAANAGAAYIFVNSGGTWTQTQKIVASDPGAADNFGHVVRISATTALIGAYVDDGAASNAGAAYIFNRTGGTWVQAQKLTASDASANQHFGYTLDLSGTSAIIGAWQDSAGGANRGAAYIFEKSGGTWTQTQKLIASDPGSGNYFGVGVAIDGTSAIVGAHKNTSNGAAYIFEKSGGTWTQTQKLTASDGAAGDDFGVSVDIEGSLVVVGSHANDDKGANSGSAYIFNKVATTWTQIATLTASDGATDDTFGRWVSLSGQTLLVGAAQHNHGAADTGAAYIFGPPGSAQAASETVRTEVIDSLDEGLVAHWKMDEGQGTTVRDSVGGYDGTFLNTPVWIHGVKGAGALSFNMAERDAVTIPTFGSAVFAPNAATIAAWVNISSPGTSGSEVFTIGDLILRVIADGTPRMYVHYAAGLNFRSANGSAPLDKGWNYLVGTFDAANDNIRIYANGTLVGETAFTETPYYDGTLDARIGRHPGQTFYDLNGGVDDVRVYGRSLGPAEVAELSFRAQHESTVRQFPALKPATGNYEGKLGVGRYHSCAIKPDNSAWCWGQGTIGELGNGKTVTHYQPVRVDDPGPWKIVSSGESYSCGIKADGTAWCWGLNSVGQLGNGTILSSTVPVQVTGGGIWTWIAAADQHACGIKHDGSAWCWGEGDFGRLGNNNTVDSSSPVQVDGTGPWTSVQTGFRHSCGIKHDGSAWCWGLNSAGQLGNDDVTNSSVPVPVSGNKIWKYLGIGINGDHSCAIEQDGSAWCWGLGSFGRLGNGGVTNSLVPARVNGQGPWVSIHAADVHSCGIKHDGSAWCWGSGSVGKLGNNNTADQFAPQRVILPAMASVIQGGRAGACAVTVDGRIFCWGNDNLGELGNGTLITGDKLTPYPVSNFPGSTPWSWDDAFANITLQGNTTLGINGYWMSDDGTSNKYFGFQSKGRGVLRQNATHNQLLIDTTVAASSSQITFRAGNQATPSVDYRPALMRVEWLFNETSGTAVSSATGAHAGTIEGAPVWNPTGGAYGASGALEFTSTGLDRVTVPNHGNLRPAAVSITTFVKPEGAQAPGATIISKSHTAHTGTPGQSYGLRFEEGGGVSFVTGSAGGLDVLGPVSIRPNAWTQITATFNPAGAAPQKLLYVNGELVASKTNADPLIYDTSSTGHLYLGSGGCASLPCNNFVGAIDTTRVYGEALTAARVYEIYKFQTSGALPQTLGIDHGTGAVEIGRNNAATSNLISAIAPDFSMTSSGNFPIGSTTANSRVDVAGGVRVGYQAVCDAGSAGTIRNDLGSIYECTNNHINFVAQETTRDWRTIASSADGTKLVATVNAGQIYTSTDSGITWTPRETNRNWIGIASSADGTKLAATVNAGQIYTSTDSGATWTPRETNRNWLGIASSADGTKLAAVVQSGQIYISTDSGATWIPRDANRSWLGIASSADGTKLAATVNAGQIYTSTDSGATWTPRDANRNWYSITSSADGTKLAATTLLGQIYTSTDSGANWIPRDANRNWKVISSSADGTKLATVVTSGQIYTSTDSGVTWVSKDSSRNWFGIASSADGTKLAAVAISGQIYTSNICAWKSGWATPRQTAMLVPSDPQASTNYGSDGARTTTSLGNNVAIVGATLADGRGAAYVFDYSAGTWTQTQKLVSSDIVASDTFGFVSNIENDTVMIGAQAHDTPASNGGAVYVFTKSAGTWTQTQKIIPSDPTANKAFGGYVRISGNRAAISATGDNSNTGAIYIFEKVDGTWVQHTKIVPTGPVGGETFAQKITLSGDLLVASATGFSTNTGRAYIFERLDGVWTQTQTVQSADIAAGDRFGHQSAISGKDILFGAWGDDASAGAVYVFQKIGGTWTQTQKLVTNDRTTVREFSVGLAVENDTAVIAAIRDTIGGTNTGSAYLFKRIGGTWTQVDKFTANSLTVGDEVGRGFAIYGDRVLLGSHLVDTVAGVDRGATHVFEGIGTNTPSSNPYKYCDGTEWREFAIKAGTPVKAKRGVDSFAAGRSSSCFIDQAGAGNCWGAGNSGQLGNGLGTASTIPVSIRTSRTWKSIVVGHLHTCGIASDGVALCWGSNSSGRLGDGTTSNRATPTLVSGNYVWSKIQTAAFTCGIQTNGSAWCWGGGAGGQLGDGLSTDSSVPVEVSGSYKWVDVSTGQNNTCGIQADGTAWCWGSDTSGKMGNGVAGAQSTPFQVTGTGSWKKIAVGPDHACGIKTDGTAWCWGRGDYGQMGNGTTTAANQDPVQVTSALPWADITVSEYTGGTEHVAHSCGIKTNGTAWCWGRGGRGQMGNGTNTATNSTPVQVSGAGTWVGINAGPDYTCGQKSDSTLWCWGSEMQMDTGDSTTPTQVVY